MEAVILLLKQNLIMFLYMMIGLLLYKGKVLTKTGSGELAKVLLYLVMPVAIMKSYIQEYSAELLVGLAISFVAALLSLLLSMAVCTLLFGKRDTVRQFGVSFSNAGFMGIPLVQMTLGDSAVFFVASYVALLNFLQWTYGIYVMTKDKSCIKPRKIITNPVLIAFFAGLLLFFLPVTLPAPIMGMVSTIASMNGPLAMIVLGCYLAQIPLRQLVTDKMTYFATVVRLIFIPALTVLGLWLMPTQYQTIRMAVLIAAAAPIGCNTAIFAAMFSCDYKAAVKDVCLSTLLSIGSMPLILAFATLLW